MALRFRLSTLLVLPVLLMLGLTAWRWRDTWAIDATLLLGAVWGACQWGRGIVGRALGAGLGAAVTALFLAPSLLHMGLVDEHFRISRVSTSSLVRFYVLGGAAYVTIMFLIAVALALPVLWVGRMAMRTYLRVVQPLARPMREEAGTHPTNEGFVDALDRVPASSPSPTLPSRERGPE